MLNVILLQGRLVADPEMRRTQNDIAVANFRIAVDRDIKGQNDEQAADFINIIAWRKTAEFVVNYFRKANMILIEGRLQVRSYTDQEGTRRIAAEVVANRVHFAASKRESEQQTYQTMDGRYDPPVDPFAPAPPDADFRRLPITKILDDSDGDLPF